MRRQNASFRLTSAFATNAVARRSMPSRPFSIRLSEDERRQLQREAGSQALGAYVKARLLAGEVRRARSAAAVDAATLGVILGRLGRLQLTGNLAALVAAAKVGAITITPELEAEVRAVCRDIRDMRAKLIQALGLRVEART